MSKLHPGLAVLKFGGAALATTDRIAAAARLVASATRRYPQIVVVVSAMGRTTDALLHLIAGVGGSVQTVEGDLIAATGEQVSAGLMSMALQGLGLRARPFLGTQVRILTDAAAGAAQIKSVERTALIESLLRGEIPVICGFQGVGPRGQVTTLGRGGSDTTAVAVAATLGAAVCEFYKDVEGVYDADPSAEPKAAKLATLSYDEMLVIAQGGARVLNAGAVALAKEHGVTMHVRSAFSEASGTVVTSETRTQAGGTFS